MLCCESLIKKNTMQNRKKQHSFLLGVYCTAVQHQVEPFKQIHFLNIQNSALRRHFEPFLRLISEKPNLDEDFFRNSWAKRTANTFLISPHTNLINFQQFVFCPLIAARRLMHTNGFTRIHVIVTRINSHHGASGASHWPSKKLIH